MLNDHNIFAFKATRDPDMMYYHEAMKAHDRPRFVETINKEIDSLQSTNTFKIVPRTSIPAGTQILPMVWNMRRKINQNTGEITKYKARLNIDGSKMMHKVDYYKTYAPFT